MEGRSRLEEQVFVQLDELRRLRAENEQLHLKNKLILAQLEAKGPEQTRKDRSGDMDVSQNSSELNSKTARLTEQVEQLQGVIERLRVDLEDNEEQKLELQLEVEHLKEALQEVGKLDANYGESGLQRPGSAVNPSLLREKNELADMDRELQKKARILEDKQVALLNKESQLREWEIRLSAKEAELQLQAMAPPTKIGPEGPTSGNAVSFGSMGFAGVGADSASLQGTFGSAVGADRKAQFEIAKKKHQDDLERERQSQLSKNSVSPSDGISQPSRRKMMAMKDDITIEENDPTVSQAIDPNKSNLGRYSQLSQFDMNESRKTYEYIKPRRSEDASDPQKMTFDPTRRTTGFNADKSQVSNTMSMVQNHIDEQTGLAFSSRQDPQDLNWIEQDADDFDDALVEGNVEPTEQNHSRHTSGAELPLKSNTSQDLSQGVEKKHSVADDDGTTDANSKPDSVLNKKGVAFDLFEDKIDEKRRQTLIQKLERNRGVTAEKRAAAVAAALLEKEKNPPQEGEKDGYLARHRAAHQPAQVPINNNFLAAAADNKSQTPSLVSNHSRAGPSGQGGRFPGGGGQTEEQVRGRVPILSDKTGEYGKEGVLPRRVLNSPADRRLGKELAGDISPKPSGAYDSRKSVGLSSQKKTDGGKSGGAESK